MSGACDGHDRRLRFRKMHGLGNDFVVIDARGRPDPVTPDLARALGDRHHGVGFDQLAVISDAPEATAALSFWNADGSRAGACGNATRCVADLLMREGIADPVLLTANGRLEAQRRADGLVAVDMGPARTGWRDIPLAEDCDTVSLPIAGEPGAVGMGNPHCVFFVPDAARAPVETLGPAIERHPLFPERTNVQFAEVIDRAALRARVWERGTGVTLASGSSACAVVVAGHRKGLIERAATVHLDGGALEVTWRPDGHVVMAGPVAEVFEGSVSPDFLAEVAL